MRLSTPVLSDPDLTVSKAYHASEYGMMGTSRDEHTFILGKPDGSIGWRADYGGAPRYAMFVPTADLLADLKTRTGAGRSSPCSPNPTAGCASTPRASSRGSARTCRPCGRSTWAARKGMRWPTPTS